jgi:ferredoxin
MIEEGDYIIVVGNCKATNDRFVVVDEMRKYINDEEEHQVEYLDPDDQEKIEFNGFMWHRDDVRLVRKANGMLVHEDGEPYVDEEKELEVKETNFFKLDDTLIKSII